MMKVHLTYSRNLLVFFGGCVLMAHAAYWVEAPLRRNGNQARTIEERDEIITPVKTSFRVRDLNEEQRTLFSNNKPKMIEKTKIMNRIRQLKDRGEEKIKVIYRTRIIGDFDQKTVSEITANEKLFDWPYESDEEGDFFDNARKTPKTDNYNQELKEFESGQNNEMPLNQHSAKKELRSHMIHAKSMENLADENNYKEPKLNIHNTNVDNTVQSPGRTAFRKVNFAESKEENKMKLDHPTNVQRKIDFLATLEDENETGFKRPVNPVAKTLIDSLELYKNQQKLKEVQVLNELKSIANHNTFSINNSKQPKPILRRQFSIYRHPVINLNPVNNLANADAKYPVTSKPIFQHPSDTIILMPAENNFNSNPNHFKEQHLFNVNLPFNKINPEPTKPTVVTSQVSNTVKPDWIGDLLMKKVAQVEAAQMAQVRAAQVQLNEAQQKEQQILHKEQQIHPKIAVK